MKKLAEYGYPAVVEINLSHLANNLEVLARDAGGAEVMAVVKANAYGAGLTEVALELWRQGVRWFGVARVPEAVLLREELVAAGVNEDEAHIFSWLGNRVDGYMSALDNGVQVSVSSRDNLAEVVEARNALANLGEHVRPAPIHLKVDVGMSRGGVRLADLPSLAAKVRTAVEDGSVDLVGLWSHLSQADDPFGPGRDVTEEQIARFEEALTILAAAGLEPKVRHLEATAGTIWFPEGHFDMVRLGIGLYGLSPAPTVETAAQLGLRPVVRVVTQIQDVKRLDEGDAVSYGGTWRAASAHWVGLVPVGYADGVPRSLSSGGPIATETPEGLAKTPILGRVCMDQVVIDLGTGENPRAQVGDRVVLIGDCEKGEPSAEDWAAKVGSINYEVIAALPRHLERVYVRDR